uniref:DCD domain-containing protein n=1 Tax=Physcomitrium patens TaxID=3218 RepID=A0A2K1IEE2_PHYPA|nr:hypothetical protein PHYPA_029796 [Physcomitrium patens]
MIYLSILVPQLQHRAPSLSELLPPHLVVKKLCHGHTHKIQLSTGRLTIWQSLEELPLALQFDNRHSVVPVSLEVLDSGNPEARNRREQEFLWHQNFVVVVGGFVPPKSDKIAGLTHSGPLASQYSLWLWDGIGGSGDTTKERNWVTSSANHSWSLPPTDQNWSLAAAAAPYYERQQPQMGILERQSNPPAASKEFKRTVGDGRRGSKQQQSTGGEHKGSQVAESKQFSSEQKQQLPGENNMPGPTAPKTGVSNGNTQFQVTVSHEKRFKSLPSAEVLPRNVTLGGYIFVCNNDTMQEDLKRQLFGLPQRYRDSVRTIQPGLPLFLYNYTTHQLHGIFEAASFGGSNIDPTAWEDKKCRGESRFPAQVRTRIRKQCKPLEEDSFRPVLHHYDGPKFRLQLSVPEAVELLDLFEENGSP